MSNIKISGQGYEMRPIGEIIPYARNAKTHDGEQLVRLRASLREFGFVRPLLIDHEGNLLAGHGILAAAKAEGMTEVPCVLVEGMTDTQRRAYIHADNRLSELGGWDEEMLALDLKELSEMGMDLTCTGFELPDIELDLEEEREPVTADDGDEDAGHPDVHITQSGDVWVLGDHRVLCGDCRRPELKALLLNGQKPELLLTDPPYCSQGDAGSIGTTRAEGDLPTIANDTLSPRGYQQLIADMMEGLPVTTAYIFTDWRMWVYLSDLVEGKGYSIRSMIVWDKLSPGMGSGWRTQHELILMACRGKTPFDNHKGYGNVLSVARTGNHLHPTQKPVELIRALLDNTDWAHGVVDPFGGSGTTLMVCEEMGQPCFMAELKPGFVDTIVHRWAKATGRLDEIRLIRAGEEVPRTEWEALMEE